MCLIHYSAFIILVPAPIKQFCFSFWYSSTWCMYHEIAVSTVMCDSPLEWTDQTLQPGPRPDRKRTSSWPTLSQCVSHIPAYCPGDTQPLQHWPFSVRQLTALSKLPGSSLVPEEEVSCADSWGLCVNKPANKSKEINTDKVSDMQTASPCG